MHFKIFIAKNSLFNDRKRIIKIVKITGLLGAAIVIYICSTFSNAKLFSIKLIHEYSTVSYTIQARTINLFKNYRNARSLRAPLFDRKGQV